MRIQTALLSLLLAVPVLAEEAVDLGVVNRIRTEAFENSKVMEHLSYLSDVYGPRLTGSPEFKQAADWALERLKGYGLRNGHLEKWGPFGRSWSLEQFAVEMLEPRYALLSAWPLAWTAGTNGPVSGEPFLAPLKGPAGRMTEDDLKKYKETYKGRLRGKIVLLSDALPNVTEPENRPALRRYTDAELAQLAQAPEVRPRLCLSAACGCRRN